MPSQHPSWSRLQGRFDHHGVRGVPRGSNHSHPLSDIRAQASVFIVRIGFFRVSKYNHRVIGPNLRPDTISRLFGTSGVAPPQFSSVRPLGFTFTLRIIARDLVIIIVRGLASIREVRSFPTIESEESPDSTSLSLSADSPPSTAALTPLEIFFT